MVWTVFTGDIVNSSDLGKVDLDDLIDAVHDTSDRASRWPGRDARTTQIGFARRGGDGWQIACADLRNPLRLALCVQTAIAARIDGAASRIAVATASGDRLATLPDDLNSAHGPAFTRSGRLLDRLEGHRLMAHADGGACDALFCLADHMAQGWTQAQARALSFKLRPDAPANREIGAALGISRQAVDQALHGAGYMALADALARLEDTA